MMKPILYYIGRTIGILAQLDRGKSLLEVIPDNLKT